MSDEKRAELSSATLLITESTEEDLQGQPLAEDARQLWDHD